MNLNSRSPVERFSSMTSVPVMSDGIRSGVNWMRLKSSDRHLDSVRIIKRLGQAGHAFEDAVAPAEQGDEQLLDDLVLADDDAAELLLDVRRRRP